MKKDISFASIIFIISVLLLFDKLFVARPIQIVVEGGKVVPIEGESFFTFGDVIFFIVCTAIAGASATYIFLKSDIPQEKREDIIQAAARLLEGDEGKLYKMILDAGGEILQKDLILEGAFDKVKVTRLLDKLESKGLVVRVKHGMTNRVVLKKEL
jgi:hypothetical protein